MKNLMKKIGIGALSLSLLGSCATQKYATIEESLNHKEYAITKKILKKENRNLNKVERKYNKALESKETMQYSEFVKFLQDYESQKSLVQKYEDILRLNQERESLKN